MSIFDRSVIVPLLCLFLCGPAQCQKDRIFSIPLDDLKDWSQKVTISVNVEILGHSKVHNVDADCEMHFGAHVPSYRGEPDGWVLEPMNLCLESFPGKSGHSNRDWEDFGTSLTGARVRVDGVPRIWPEHLVGGGPSNPNHAIEIHPVVKLQRGNKIYDFATFVYAPEGFPGGVSEGTAQKILTDTEVEVTENDGMVEVDFASGRIGNFTTLEISVDGDSVEKLSGGHRADGAVVLSRTQRIPVRLLTIEGSEADKTIDQFGKSKRHRKTTFDALVLFSLNPEALYKAAKDSHGKQMPVQNALQIIVYGQPDTND